MKILMHTCCAPCLEYPAKVFKDESIDFVSYFYNPNIQPYWEYERRKKALEDFAELKEFELIISSPQNSILIAQSMANETLWKGKTDAERCVFCYKMRLDKVGKYAKDNGFEYFSSTLLLSIYQNHDLIVKTGHDIADKYSVKFYDRDFRGGFRESQTLAKGHHLYRQKHCGCIVSLYRSALKDKIIGNAPRDWVSTQ